MLEIADLVREGYIPRVAVRPFVHGHISHVKRGERGINPSGILEFNLINSSRDGVDGLDVEHLATNEDNVIDSEHVRNLDSRIRSHTCMVITIVNIDVEAMHHLTAEHAAHIHGAHRRQACERLGNRICTLSIRVVLDVARRLTSKLELEVSSQVLLVSLDRHALNLRQGRGGRCSDGLHLVRGHGRVVGHFELVDHVVGRHLIGPCNIQRCRASHAHRHIRRVGRLAQSMGRRRARLEREATIVVRSHTRVVCCASAQTIELDVHRIATLDLLEHRHRGVIA